MLRVRVIVVNDHGVVSHERFVSSVPRAGDSIEVEGQAMTVRSVTATPPDSGLEAFVYVIPTRRDDPPAGREPGS